MTCTAAAGSSWSGSCAEKLEFKSSAPEVLSELSGSKYQQRQFIFGQC